MKHFLTLLIVLALPLSAQQPDPQPGLQIQPGAGPIIIQPGGRFAQPGGANVAPAASASFDPANARMGRPFEYRVTITGGERVADLPEPLPFPPGLEGANAGRSMSTVMLNGQAVLSTTFRYTVIASRAGGFVVPGFDVTLGTQKVRVPAAQVIVSEAQPGEAAYQPVRGVLDLPQRDLFVGETVSARLLLFETPDESPSYVAHVSKTSGSVVFRTQQTSRREQITWQGKPAMVMSMPVQITPMIEGESEVNCEIMAHVQKLDPFGRRNGFQTQQTIRTQSARIRTLAVPRAGRLPGFNGAIGRFTLAQPKLSANEAQLGEPLTLTVSLSGAGNLEGVPAPELPAESGWQAYKPTADFQRNVDDAITPGGTKTWTYTLVPRAPGQRGTPPLPFSFFDPEKREYVDATIPPLPVAVKGSPAPAAAAGAPGETKPETSASAEPVREPEPVLTGLAEAPGAWHKRLGPALWQPWFLWAQAAPPLVLLLLWAWRKRQEHHAAHPEIRRRRLARAAASRALAEANSAARRGDQGAFLAAGLGALREAAAPLDTARAGSLTSGEVLRLLDDDERASKAARAIFETAEAARYASPDAALPKADTLLPELRHAVEKLTARA